MYDCVCVFVISRLNLAWFSYAYAQFHSIKMRKFFCGAWRARYSIHSKNKIIKKKPIKKHEEKKSIFVCPYENNIGFYCLRLIFIVDLPFLNSFNIYIVLFVELPVYLLCWATQTINDTPYVWWTKTAFRLSNVCNTD